MPVDSTFAEALVSSAPATEFAAKLSLYGQFVGDWSTETLSYRSDGSTQQSEWHIRFAWVLEGRAVQDVWITPARTAGVAPGWQQPGNRYGTTLRIFDPALDAWHILWINPPSGTIVRQIGRQVGDSIIQTAPPDPNGDLTRWVFRDVRTQTFRWFNERSTDGGSSWQIVQEMRARRVTT
jgi:hypothetical protein